MVADFVGEGAVEGSAGLQGACGPDDVVQQGDPVSGVARWAGVREPLHSRTAVVAVDFRHHKHVEVVVAQPGGEGFDLGLVGARKGLEGGDAVF